MKYIHSIRIKLIIAIIFLMLFSNAVIGIFSYSTAKIQLDKSGQIILTNGVHMIKEAIKLQQDEVHLGNKTLETAQEEVKQLILGPKSKDNTRPINRDIDLGENGYFFILNDKADELAHPSIEGTNTWDTLDMSGDDFYVARDIIEKALNGGGFTYYSWEYPYDGRIAPKVSYSEVDDYWNWIIVASIYMEDFNKGADQILIALFFSSVIAVSMGIVVIIYINYRISAPIISISNEMTNFTESNMEFKPIKVKSKDEIKKLSDSYNIMAKTVNDEIKKRMVTEESLKTINAELEDRVKERTRTLYETNEVLQETLDYSEIQKRELSILNENLEYSLEELQTTQDHLIESEKMAAMSNLVSGIAHEINTPIGTCITLTSYIEKIHQNLVRAIEADGVSKKSFTDYSNDLVKSVKMQSTNLDKAAELVKKFKEVSVDYHLTLETEFDLKEYFEFLLLGLKHYNIGNHNINYNFMDDCNLKSYPSIFSQLFTHLIINSYTHGFKEIVEGEISIDVTKNNNILSIVYSDNGIGIDEVNINQVFNPFFTTNRSKGSTGLGLFIVYNLVTHKMKGTIKVESAINKGTTFRINIPI